VRRGKEEKEAKEVFLGKDMISFFFDVFVNNNFNFILDRSSKPVGCKN
jgi:hypothetical protein